MSGKISEQGEFLRNIVKNNPSKSNTELANSILIHYPSIGKTKEQLRLAFKNIKSDKNQNMIKKTKKEVKGEVVLAIGDLHAPFLHVGYLDFLKGLADEYQPSRIVFIGDIVDNHAMSFHDVNSDGYSAGNELLKAREALQPYYEEFPIADVVLGNHDNLPFRKATRHGISQHVMRNPQEIWKSPDGWTWSEELWIDRCRYCHGTGMGKADDSAKRTASSTIFGHWHASSFVKYLASRTDRIFAMQVGCGIDYKAYAFEYGKAFKEKPMLSAGLIFGGVKAIIEPMDLGVQLKSSRR